MADDTLKKISDAERHFKELKKRAEVYRRHHDDQWSKHSHGGIRGGWEGDFSDVAHEFERIAKKYESDGEADLAASYFEKAAEVYEFAAGYSKKHNFGQNVTITMEHWAEKEREKAERLRGGKKGLEGHVSTIVFIIVGLAGLFFLSPNVTGSVIGSMTTNISNITGAILFFIGLIGLFFTFRRR